jgi:FAD/FMN-containing dehydrogenase
VTHRLDRRRFLAGALTGTAVVAFDTVARSWLTEASASTSADAVAVPHFDGELITDPEVLAQAADDFGHIVHRTPVAVLRPGSVQDVVRLVRYANRYGIRVAMRGQGHTTLGQAQVDGGVVIDSRTLAAIHRVDRQSAVVDAGVLWLDLARATLAHGVTPPVFTDYVGLSVGGTLGVGGIGGTTKDHGLQVDNVLALEVVTGDGRLVECSPDDNRALFEAVLGGLGQFAILVRATIRLVSAPTNARGYQLYYSDLGSYLADQRRLLADGRFSSLEGQAIARPDGTGWDFFVDAAAYYAALHPPDDAALLAGLRFDPARTVIVEYTFLDWVDRLAPTIEFLKQIGVWGFPHPWLDLFLPDSRTEAFVRAVLADLTVADTGQGPVLLYPFRPGRLHRPFVEGPDEPVAFLFSVLRTTVPPDPALVEQQLAANRALYDGATAIGGKRYPVGSVRLTPADWQEHYGPDWPAFAAAKSRYDPRHVLTPGQGIFS